MKPCHGTLHDKVSLSATVKKKDISNVTCVTEWMNKQAKKQTNIFQLKLKGKKHAIIISCFDWVTKDLPVVKNDSLKTALSIFS
jgi:hypothetical protein